MEIVLDECFHGIPLVNGKGCMKCSNRRPVDKIYVRMERGTRETTILQKLRESDMVEEVSTANLL